MDIFQKIISFLTYAAILISVVEVYFKINKIWKRKHEKEVAESQSIVGLGMSSFVMIIWALDSFIKGNFEAIADNVIYFAEAVICIIIGTGFFVIEEKKKHKNFWAMIKSALRLERKEAGYLWKTLSGKLQAEKIVELLLLLAWIDDQFNKSEKEIIEKLATPWGIKITEDQLYNNPFSSFKKKSKRFETVKQLFREYLIENSSKDQILHIKNLFNELISSDGKISQHEEIIMGEIDGVIKEYLGESMPKFSIIIIPKQDNLRESIESIVKSVNPEINMKEREQNIDGGFGFIVDECYSQDYAEILAEEQRSQHNNLTIVKKGMINTL
jgi:hypothetical protein